MKKQWLVIYTKSRSERKVSERLLERGYAVYCPLRKETRIWSDRKKKVEVPLFSCYIFVFITELERIKILSVPGVVNFIFWLQKPAVIRDTEIEALKGFLSDHPGAKSKALDIQKGQEVNITYGQLKDKKGIVVEVRSHTAMIRLEDIGFELTAEVSMRDLD